MPLPSRTDRDRPRPWSDLPAEAAARLVGVFTDIDDTLTAEGAIEPAALAALHRLHEANVPVIAVTGRPMGWSEPFARDWPVAAIVAENGAVALLRDNRGGNDSNGNHSNGNPSSDSDGVNSGLRIEYAQDAPTRARNALRLQATARRILRAVPGATLARDSAGRVTDIAIDHAEFAHLPTPSIEQVVALMQADGMTATVSSIHINGWFGEHTKLSGARWMLQRLFGRALDAEIDRWVYVGDSTNDQQMFAAFPVSVGVANLMRFAGQLVTWPSYITAAERGAGFAQVAQRIITASSSR